MKTLILILAFAFTGFSQSDVSRFIDHYETIGDHLVNGDAKSTSAEAKKAIEFLKSAKIDHSKEIIAYLEPIANSVRLDNQRTKYADVSRYVWKTYGASSKNRKYYYIYCPMKKAYWVSSDSRIENPYYGKQMLTCGKVVETSK